MADMTAFSGKKILFFAPKFFGYEHAIKLKLESLGAEVDFFDERPSNTTWFKSCLRVCRWMVRHIIRKYFTGIINTLPVNAYDFVFLIKMEAMPKDCLTLLKRMQPRATFIYYTYDSVKNNHNAISCLNFFDRAFTFDRQDANDFNIRFRPLFFLDSYRNIPQGKLSYDWCFIGTAHSDRYILNKQFQRATQSYHLNSFIFLYIPSNIIYWIKKILLPSFLRASKSEFSFQPLTKAEIIAFLSKSVAVLDFQHPKQTGLTMRTIEMLGAHKKLITTNQDVRNYDFYHPNNILIINRNFIQVDAAFFTTPYVKLDSQIYEKYSIGGWLEEIFFEKP